MASLKSFIKAVRASKTIAAERATIRKESAAIRTAFRDVHLDETSRRNNIAKLLYLYILGEPTYFGQVECLKLLASNKFTSKRLGYLACMLILDENQEVLTLLTNSLDNDTRSNNQYIAGLAIVTLGNVASPDLARDLFSNIEDVLKTKNAYLRKKAAIVAAKLIEKDDDLTHIYLNYLSSLLTDSSHGVVLGGLQLVRVIYQINELSRDTIKNQAMPLILLQLKSLLASGHSPEYDDGDIPDPFLFTSILQTIRIILKDENNDNNMEAINDLITQIPPKVHRIYGNKLGYSILYETVITIFNINADSSLKTLAIDMLSGMLTSKDKNLRYIGLNTMLSVIQYEPLAVQRHRNIIIGCLKDKDISIRRRALELTFAIMNKQNIRILTKELLSILQSSSEPEEELRAYMATQLTISINKFSPNLKWQFEILVELLKSCGNHFNIEILSNVLSLIMNNKELDLSKYILVELVKASDIYYNQFGLNLITIWCIGEYGDLILGSKYEDAEKKTVNIDEEKLVSILTNYLSLTSYDEYSVVNTPNSLSLANHNENKIQIILYLLTASIKLSVKLDSLNDTPKNRKSKDSLKSLIESQSNSPDLEVQLRSIEYLKIWDEPINVKKGLLERMPSPPVKKIDDISLIKSDKKNPAASSTTNGHSSGHTSSSKTEDLLDLLGDSITTVPSQTQSNVPSTQPQVNTMDLLSDIFGTTPSSSNNGLPSRGAAAVIPSASIKTSSSNQQFSVTSEADLGYENEHVNVYFEVEEIVDNTAKINCKVVNICNSALSNLSISFAVTKGQKLQLFNISKKQLSGLNDFASLSLNITGSPGAKLKVKSRLSYSVDGSEAVVHQFNYLFKKTL